MIMDILAGSWGRGRGDSVLFARYTGGGGGGGDFVPKKGHGKVAKKGTF